MARMKKASIRQIRTFHFINQGMSKRAAMIKAGYSINTANQALRVMQTHSMRTATISFADELINTGLTLKYLAWKLKKLLDATKYVDGKIVPDYMVQIKALRQCLGILNEVNEPQKEHPQRRLSVVEWVNQSS